jgi:phospholipid/cholesterol/gamma-HCH transport system substrate-binding protein
VRTTYRAALWRLGAFTTACAAVLFVLVVVFGQVRFDDSANYKADFNNIGGLETGNFVRIAGVEVGKVSKVSLLPDSKVRIQFDLDHRVVLTRATTAVIRYADLLGGRFLELDEGTGDGHGIRLQSGQTIAVDKTFPALDLDSLIGGFRPLSVP